MWLLHTGYSKEYEVLLEYYDDLANNLPTKNIANKLIAKQIITHDDQEEINHKSRSQDQASYVLNLVARSLQTDNNYFYLLLDIMDEYGGVARTLASKIRERLK